ncbi:hypothetical protein F4803DRAFT_566623 [Xylaria telfairii]|nr:hypothetical protein F4803DRAFT_566623 [Xylaria telfairii]
MDNFAHRSALGVAVPLGALYDARKDRFVASSLFKADCRIPQVATTNVLDTAPMVSISSGDGYQTKFDCLDTKFDQGASIIAGFVKPKGSGAYISDPARSYNCLQAAIVRKVPPLVDLSSLTRSEATHFVAGVEWGIRSIVAIKYQLITHIDPATIEAQFHTEVTNFKSAIDNIQKGDVASQRLFGFTKLPLEIVTYSDVFESEQEFLKKGRPMMYRLLPLGMVGLLMEVDSVITCPYVEISAESTHKFIQLFDHPGESARVAVQILLWGGGNSPSEIASVTEGQRSKIEFAVSATRRGAIYVESKQAATRSMNGRGASILFYSQSAMKDHENWKANKDLFEEMLDHPRSDTIFILADLDSAAQELRHSYVSIFENGVQVSEYVLQHHRWMAESCFARYNISTLETHDIQRPVKRRFIVIPCPTPDCSREHTHDWICSRCFAPVEFGFTDQYLYCDCGRSLYKEAEVGKSTFINSFVNYLTFESLDDAKAANQLHSVIPCSFSTQIMNRNSPDGRIEQIKIQVGMREDEKDGTKGASATQHTTVYPVTIGRKTIRLIDTPGIGDTRGYHYDKRNMADILATLSSYDELHGILILLKPKSSRLNATFRFCMEELLMHLHRSAARNMAFGFTNTRISNYTPGDIFGPLNALLETHSDIGFRLTTHTTYCFDSETFLMENEQDFRRSWQHSRTESLRLVGYFKTRSPHRVQSTISLNGARQLISDLTKPMADIASLIHTNIAVTEDRIKELQDTRMIGHSLRKRVNIQRIFLRSKQLDRPRTVCQDRKCIRLQDDGSSERKSVTIYKSHCHLVCYLKGVKTDQIAPPGLTDCTAFQGHDHCQVCNHHWQSHLHVLYELEEYTTTVKDTEVQNQLQKNAEDVANWKTAIDKLKSMNAEYKDEHDKIQHAAASFGIFLEKHSIMAYNDATLEYLDMLIRDEEAKAQVGGTRTRLDSLRTDRACHEELVKALTRNMNNKRSSQYRVLDEAGVERTVKELYELEHFGENLKDLKNNISLAHQATYRERPYRI